MAVLVIYTGGTIGSVCTDPDNPLSPRAPASWEVIKQRVPALRQAMKDLGLEVDSHEFNPPLDSSNMQPKDWLEIAKVIRRDYDKYEGFCILHGTDTMTYTATALSFILENLSKPVVLTGSQLPIDQVRSDALQNLITALQIAAPETTGLPVVPEVCIFFRNQLLRGNRSRKTNASGYDAYDSPNYPPLGMAGEEIKINKGAIMASPKQGFYITEKLETNVLSFDIFPGIPSQVLKSVCETPNLRGLILKTYGTGNAPTDELFLQVIEDAVRKGITVVDVTQCLIGMVEIGLYETSAELLNRGVVSGLNMTPEAALCKLVYLISLGYTAKDVNMYIQQNMRGEQSVSIYDVDYDQGEAAPSSSGAKPQPIPGVLEKSKIKNAVVRIQDVRLPKTIKSGVKFSVSAFINLPDATRETPRTAPQYVGTVDRTWDDKPINLFFNATRVAETVLDPRRPVFVTVVTDQERLTWRRMILSVYAEV